ncbi:hypothetical protein SAMN05444170_0986 [Bradyrhizobium erythrophlei]|uniref:Uncharacterized protein n=1 Tax=Bradyrhizobium erythrophlei TaxID=1437360 RepID=A0A1M7T756_9BRAD|nr:hypothetical protein SAMN05444170_0986 [Bradyrhizobium erythrophlei]
MRAMRARGERLDSEVPFDSHKPDCSTFNFASLMVRQSVDLHSSGSLSGT